MSDLLGRLFLFVLVAERGGEDQRPGRRTVLAFALATSLEEAMDIVAERLSGLGWRVTELQGLKELSINPASEADPIAQDAMERALSGGFAHVVY